MKENYLIPRYSLFWLMFALVAVVLPHAGRMPFWLLSIMALCIGLRILILQGRVNYPGKLFKTGVVLLILAGSVLQYGRSFLSAETMTAILLTGTTLKLLELKKQRDVLLIIYLNYFAVMSEFIFAQSIPVTLYIFIAVAINTTALLTLQQKSATNLPFRSFRKASWILVQSVPVMIILFVLFPRISPLWSMPMQNTVARTGLSDRLDPGGIGELMRSEEVAFKVQFDNDIPANSELYWRAVTLDLFNGRSWTRFASRFDPSRQNLSPGNSEQREWFRNIEFIDEPKSYNIIMEPSGQTWLYSLQMPQLRRENIFMNREYQLESTLPVSQRISYDVQSWTQFSIGDIEPEVRRRSLILPESGNELSRDLAVRMRAGSASDREYIDSVLDMFARENFFYTLSPRPLGENFVDAFLFDSREGFCGHYASSFAYLMRAAGIPARVVMGYQGGERNPYDETLIVRQYDAHAWSEVWIDGEGWLRVDPTAAIAPERISLGSEQSYQQDENFLSDAGVTSLWMRQNLILNEVRLYLETIDYAWSRFVVNYDQSMQFGLFSRLFRVVSTTKIAITLLVMTGIFFLGLAYFLLPARGLKSRDEATTYYLKFCKQMAGRGLQRKPGETPLQYSQRLVAEYPGMAAGIKKVTKLYYRLSYLPVNNEKERKRQLQALKNTVWKLRLTH